MKKKSKGKGLSVLSGRALYDYDANLFVVSDRETPNEPAGRGTVGIYPGCIICLLSSVCFLSGESSHASRRAEITNVVFIQTGVTTSQLFPRLKAAPADLLVGLLLYDEGLGAKGVSVLRAEAVEGVKYFSSAQYSAAA